MRRKCVPDLFTHFFTVDFYDTEGRGVKQPSCRKLLNFRLSVQIENFAWILHRFGCWIFRFRSRFFRGGGRGDRDYDRVAGPADTVYVHIGLLLQYYYFLALKAMLHENAGPKRPGISSRA
jgi:hypothetical protein